MRTILGAGGVIANELVRMRRGDLEPTPYPEGIERTARSYEGPAP